MTKPVAGRYSCNIHREPARYAVARGLVYVDGATGGVRVAAPARSMPPPTPYKIDAVSSALQIVYKSLKL
jgi:hypothetical protein